MSDSAAGLREGIAALEALVGRERAPSHRHARAILVPLGSLLLEGQTEGLQPLVARVGAASQAIGASWLAAVESELRMAGGEHCQSVDPRYLDLAGYDFEYTVAARERLEARLVAAESLGLDVPEDLLERIARADELLEPYLRRRDAEGNGRS